MHPEFDILDHEDDPINTGCIVPLYPSTFQLKKVGLDRRGIRKLILYIINNLNIDFEDYFKGTNIINHKILELKDAIRYMHCPKTKYDIKNALYRLKFNEHFYLQLIKLLSKKNMAKNRGKSFKKLGSITRRMYKNLDFQLTNAQIKVMKEIRNDLISVSKSSIFFDARQEQTFHGRVPPESCLLHSNSFSIYFSFKLVLYLYS